MQLDRVQLQRINCRNNRIAVGWPFHRVAEEEPAEDVDDGLPEVYFCDDDDDNNNI